MSHASLWSHSKKSMITKFPRSDLEKPCTESHVYSWPYAWPSDAVSRGERRTRWGRSRGAPKRATVSFKTRRSTICLSAPHLHPEDRRASTTLLTCFPKCIGKSAPLRQGPCGPRNNLVAWPRLHLMSWKHSRPRTPPARFRLCHA